MAFVQNINFLLLTLTPNYLDELTYKTMGRPSESKKMFCVVVVIYNVHPCNSESINSLKNQINKSHGKLTLVIYDNTPNPSWTKKDIASLYEYFNIEYISDKSNPGIAKAYNYAINFANKKGFSWLLVLDQDTNLPHSFIEDSLDVLYANKKEKDIVLFVPLVKCGDIYISPCKHSFARFKPLKHLLPVGKYYSKKYSAINSGMIVNIDFVISIGSYPENYPLDYLDHWLMAAIYQHKKSFYVTHIKISHLLSTMEKRDFHTALTRHRTQIFSIINYYRDHRSILEGILSLFYFLLRSLKLSARYKNFSFFKIPGFINYLSKSFRDQR